MKICPKCSKTYEDLSLNYCLDDGSLLASASGLNATEQTAVLNSSVFAGGPTVSMDMGPTRAVSAPPQYQTPPHPKKSRTWLWALVILAAVVLLCGGGIVGLGIYGSRYATTAANARGTSLSRTPVASPTEESPQSEPTPVPGYTLTMEQYRRISNGMTRAEVEKILGSKGTQLSSSSAGDTTYTVDQWQTADYMSIILSFENDKVTFRAQSGLK